MLMIEINNIIICWLYRYCPEEQVLFTRQRLSRRIQGPSLSTDDIPIIVTQNKKLMNSRQRLEQEEEEMFTL